MLSFLGLSSGAIIGIVCGGIALALVLGIVLFFWAGYNGLVRKRNEVEEGFSTMDVYLQKRYDLIPNLVGTVKGYAKHESETLEKVIQARNMAMQAKPGSVEQADAENVLTGTLKSLFALTENYPTLQANTNFMDLQNQLKVIEQDIASSRKYYNAVVREYNTKIQVFPTNILARMFKFEKKPMFEIDDKEQRKNPKVEF